MNLETGMAGSRRQARILAAPSVTLPAGTSIVLPTARFVNERSRPLFCKSLIIGADTSTQAAFNQIAAKLSMAKHEVSPTHVPVVAFMDTVLSSTFLAFSGIWTFKRPFALMPGESVQIDLQNNNTSSVAVSAGLLGYYETRPRPLSSRFVPALLHDQVVLATASIAYLKEEALRNGPHRFDIEGLYFSVLATSTFNQTAAFSNVSLRLTSQHFDVMTAALDSSCLQVLPKAYPAANFALPFEGSIEPYATFSAEVQNSSGATQQIDVTLIGSIEEQLQ